MRTTSQEWIVEAANGRLERMARLYKGRSRKQAEEAAALARAALIVSNGEAHINETWNGKLVRVTRVSEGVVSVLLGEETK